METIKKIKAVMDKEPNLGVYGMFYKKQFEPLSDEELKARREEERELLLKETGTFEKVCSFLSPIEKTKTINNKNSSYGLKAIAEELLKIYIANGVFIAAAIHCEFNYKVFSDSPNVKFGMSAKSIKPLYHKAYNIKL